MPRYSPTLLDSFNTTGVGIASVSQDSKTNQLDSTSQMQSSLIRMEKQINADKMKISKHNDDLAKLQKLAENAENSTLTNFSQGILGLLE